MGLDVSSVLVVGIPLASLFKGIEERDNSYDEYDPRGNKTGRRVEEFGLYATLPNDSVVCVANGKRKRGDIIWEYDLYNSLGFDGDTFIGDEKTKISLYYADYESRKLDNLILGIKIESTGSHRNNETISEIDTTQFTNKLTQCAAELKLLFNFTGNIKTYLITQYSY